MKFLPMIAFRMILGDTNILVHVEGLNILEGDLKNREKKEFYLRSITNNNYHEYEKKY